MKTERRLWAVLTASAVAISLTAGSSGAAAAEPPGGGEESVAPASGSGGSVTLLTGDRVALAADGTVAAVHPAPGREDIPVQVTETDGAVHVVPRDAVAMIADGTLQRALFDVTELSRPQYQRFAGTPLIVDYQDGGTAARSELRAEPDIELRGTLDVLEADALTLAEDSGTAVWEALTASRADRGDLARSAAPGIETVSLDRIVAGALDASTAQVGAPLAWESGLDGSGVTIAVLDSGIAADHGDFGDRVALAENFTDAPGAADHYGHGTHVASIAAGSGDRSDGAFRGVAPGAELLNAKVLGDDNVGMESWVIEGMEWAAASGADIINMSLGDVVPEGPDPMAEALDRIAEESGALFVVSAGNSGPGDRTLDTPGVASAALTVGSVTKEDEISPFSAAGPRGDGALKPELSAPGSDIGAAAADGSVLQGIGRPVADGYVATSGTSMAAPHVAGAAALLIQQDPELTGPQLKSLLTSSAAPLRGPAPTQQGTGRLDLARALTQTVTTETAALDFGAVAFPAAEADPVSRELTYRNSGDEELTLDLAVDTTGPAGEAPEGMFTLDSDTVEVPAGGEATVEVTAVPSATDGTIGDYGVFVTASGGGQQVRAAGTVELEPAFFDLTVEVVGHDGGAPESGEILLFDLAAGDPVHGELGDGRYTARLPEAAYVLEVQADRSAAGDRVGTDIAVHPALVLSADTTVEVPLAEAAELDFVAPGASEPVGTVAGWDVTDGATGTNVSRETSFPALPEGIRTLALAEPGDGVALTHHAATSHRHEDGSHAFLHAGGDGWPTGLVNHPGPEEMAELNARLGATVSDAGGELGVLSGSGLTAGTIPVDLPAEQQLQLQADGEWSLHLEQFIPGGEEPVAAFWTTAREMTGGERHEAALNVGVLGPVLGESSGLFQSGASLVGLISHFSDGAGNAGTATAAGTTRLYREGVLLTEYPDTAEWFDSRLPEGEAEYRLVSTADRSDLAPGAVSTVITLDHTFTTGPVEGFEPVAGPLAVRYTPDLALDGTAPAGKKLTVPLTVTGGDAAHLTVEASFDRGETWEELKTHTKDTGYLVHVHNPAAGGSVSLRATAEDADGNRSVQTILDAYLTK